MRLWIDDVRPAPTGYTWIKTVNEAISIVKKYPKEIRIIDIDHDAGDYVIHGGDYIKFLDWLEEMGYNYPIHIHSMNPVGIVNMRTIINKNGWKELFNV